MMIPRKKLEFVIPRSELFIDCHNLEHFCVKNSDAYIETRNVTFTASLFTVIQIRSGFEFPLIS